MQGLSILRLPPEEQRQGFQGLRGVPPQRRGFVAEASPRQDTDYQVAQASQNLWRTAATDATRVFAECHITHIMQLVFNVPVLTRDCQESCSRGMPAI